MLRRFAMLLLCSLCFQHSFAADATEEGFWKSVTKGNIAEEYELYIRQFPKGQYVDAAKQRISEMHENARLREELRQLKEKESRKSTAEELLTTETARRNHDIRRSGASTLGPSIVNGLSSCRKDNECGTGLYCIKGSCREQVGSGGTCDRDTECAGLKSRCSANGRCTDEDYVVPAARMAYPGNCQSDGECSSGLYCIQGSCRQQVKFGGSCNRDTECAGLKSRCSSSGTCTGDDYVATDTRKPYRGGCQSDGECSTGLYCIQGRCGDQVGDGGSCDRSTECAGLTSQCVGGRCSNNAYSETTSSTYSRVNPESAKTLATKSGCFACHAVDKRIVGPSFQDVRRRYGSNGNSEQALVSKVKSGGSGSWGAIPMPPNSNVSDSDIRTIVRWILN